jgi:hypothetical protein
MKREILIHPTTGEVWWEGDNTDRPEDYVSMEAYVGHLSQELPPCIARTIGSLTARLLTLPASTKGQQLLARRVSAIEEQMQRLVESVERIDSRTWSMEQLGTAADWNTAAK